MWSTLSQDVFVLSRELVIAKHLDFFQLKDVYYLKDGCMSGDQLWRCLTLLRECLRDAVAQLQPGDVLGVMAYPSHSLDAPALHPLLETIGMEDEFKDRVEVCPLLQRGRNALQRSSVSDVSQRAKLQQSEADTLEVHTADDRISTLLVIDDIICTGGTAKLGESFAVYITTLRPAVAVPQLHSHT
jgi:hypothetical protein